MTLKSMYDKLANALSRDMEQYLIDEEPTEKDLEYVDRDEFVAAVTVTDRVTPRRLILTETELLEVSNYAEDVVGVSIETYSLDSIEHVDASSMFWGRLQINLKGGYVEDWNCNDALRFAEFITNEW